MDDRRRTLAAITLIVGFLVLVAVVVGVLVSGRKIVSPVQEDTSAIKIIFVTPTPTQAPIGVTITPTSTPKPTAKPKPTATPTPKPTTASSSATPEP